MRQVFGIVLVALAALASPSARVQDEPAAVHAKRVLAQLNDEKFDDVVREFNEKMAAVLPSAQLRAVWSTLRQQNGAFKTVIDQRVAKTPLGVTAVTLGCQFEKTALNVIVAFDAADHIAGLRIVPRPSAAAVSEPPTSTRFKEEPVTVGAGEWALPATLSLPVGAIAGAVVLVHGSGPHDRDQTIGPNKTFRDLAWGLADRGVAVLRYEKRTRQHAGKMAGIAALTVREETVDDAVLAALVLKSHARLDPKRVFVLGHSLGGTLAPRIAAADPAIAGLIILAGSTRPFEEVAREQIAYLTSLAPPGTSTEPEAALKALMSSAPASYWKDFNAYNPVQTAAKLTIPMLILQGERDYQVTLADLKGWRDGLAGRSSVTIKSYPTLNHLFMAGEGKATPSEYERAGHVAELVLDDIAAWIAKQ